MKRRESEQNKKSKKMNRVVNARNFCALFGGLFGLYQVEDKIFSKGNVYDYKTEEDPVETSDNYANLSKAEKEQRKLLFQKAATQARELVWLEISRSAIPGLVIAVSVDGKQVFRQGFGFADVENKVNATPSHVMRIASISKPLAMLAAARLFEDGKLDFDKPVSEYVKTWPEKHPPITLRHLASHTSGIRHYKKEEKKNGDSDGESSHDTQYPEFYSNKAYKTINEALEVFKDDDLLCEPGKEFNYTTHGFTLLSAVVEAAAEEPFTTHIKKMFRDLGLSNTYLDENEPIIPFRARYYQRDKEHKLKNVPAVDNSLKWAGGGFLSTVGDLVQFGNAMLYSFQYGDFDAKDKSTDEKSTQENKAEAVVFNASIFSPVNQKRSKEQLPPVLKQDTMKILWNPVIKTSKDGHGFFGLGWAVTEEKEGFAFAKKHRFYAAHTGGAVGASSVLLIYPRRKEVIESKHGKQEVPLPQGIVVAIICNLQNVGLSKLALDVAKIYEALPTTTVSRNEGKIEYC